MKADFEPWWMFDGWEENIVSRHSFDNEAEAKKYLNETLVTLQGKFQHMCAKKKCFYAFWAEEEKVFCEGCDDDLQIFHGIILLWQGKPFIENDCANKLNNSFFD